MFVLLILSIPRSFYLSECKYLTAVIVETKVLGSLLFWGMTPYRIGCCSGPTPGCGCCMPPLPPSGPLFRGPDLHGAMHNVCDLEKCCDTHQYVLGGLWAGDLAVG